MLFVWACVNTERLRKQFIVPDGMALVPVNTLAKLHHYEYDISDSKA
jgi:hypothetical protein